MKECDFQLRALVKGWYKDAPEGISDWLVIAINWDSRQVSLTDGRLTIGFNLADYDVEFYIAQWGRRVLG